jgi:hypothetical protein
MKSKSIMEFVTIWVLVLVAISSLLYLYQQFFPNPTLRPRLERIEAFANPPRLDEPAEMDFSNKPYSLLLDVLPEFKGVPPTPSSQLCYFSDFQTRLEKTGNMRQFTNNYKRGSPDSCSAPNHDLVQSFYKTEPLD